LAKKINRNPEEIDLTTFAWVNAGGNPKAGKPGCGGCHPGGGGLEFDRDGYRYDLRMRKNPELSETLDGDYFQSMWDRSGVIEIDCFICHLQGYYYKERIQQLGLKNYQWATISATGIGKVTGAVSQGKSPRVEYNQRLFNNDGKIVLPIVSSPLSENCNLCHAAADLLKRGFSWDDKKNHDIHNRHGFECTDCHPGNMEHQIAKGNENLSTVRDDLDGTMLTCRQCHEKGVMGSPGLEHTSIRPNHLDKFACEVCHIPYLNRAAAKGLCVSTGRVRNYPRGPGEKLGDPVLWKPDFQRDHTGQLWPVNAFNKSLYTNLDLDGRYHPLFAGELRKAYLSIEGSIRDSPGNQPAVRSEQDILKMLLALTQALRKNPRFEKIQPAYHHNGQVYMMGEDDTLNMETDNSWVGEPDGFNISHNVAPTREALGAGGCGDCHDRSSHLFQNWIVGEAGPHQKIDPVMKSGLLLGKEVLVKYLTEIHTHNHLKVYVCPILFFLMFLSVIRRISKKQQSLYGHRTSGIWSGKTHALQINRILGAICILLLATTGYIFFFNQMFLLKIFFKTFQSAVLFHCFVGILFIITLFLEKGLETSAAISILERPFYLKAKGPGLILKNSTEKNTGKMTPLKQITQLGVVMGITGFLSLLGNYLEVEVQYILSIIHTFFAIFLLAFCSGWIYLWIENSLRQIRNRTGTL
jgi:hypothetical protein